jgi:hypothetical protein
VIHFEPDENPRDRTSRLEEKTKSRRRVGVTDAIAKQTTVPQVPIVSSLSATQDGGLVAIANVARAADRIGLGENYRLIGGIAVVLHIDRLGLDLPLRQTGDADCGVRNKVLLDGRLVAEIESMGYSKIEGNRWEKALNAGRVATVDLLVPAFTSYAHHTKRVGDVVTTEVPGLADAFMRPAVTMKAELWLSRPRPQPPSVREGSRPTAK